MKVSAVTVALGAIKAVAAITCDEGYTAGYDEVVETLPYSYEQVMSIIGDYKNITWSGTAYDDVTLNGTDNTAGTARTYELDGATLVETLITYSKPDGGPYYEDHYLGLLYLSAYNLSAYAPHDTTTVTATCNDTASIFNMSVSYCASDATVAQTVFHSIHATDIETVREWLGNETYTGCSTATTSTANSSVSATSTAGLALLTGSSGLSASSNMLSLVSALCFVGGSFALL
jgi:hypothetical protein